MPDSKPSRLGAFLACKCPRCMKGRVFEHSVFNPAKFSKTYDYCPYCHLKYEHETGFFWSAMYISYMFSAGIMIVFGVIAINLDWSFKSILLVLFPSILLITPFSFRYSRMLVLYLMHPHRRYDPAAGMRRD